MEKYLLLIKTLVFLWLISVVIAHSDIEKRDVHHRIILRDRKPRSHRSHHYRNHDHNHGHYHDHDNLEHHGKYNKHNYGKHGNHDHEHTLEESGKYYDSHESSYEEMPKHKGHQHYHHYHHKSTKSSKNRPHFTSTEFTDDKLIEPHRAEWTPLLNSESIFHSQDTFSHNSKRRPHNENKKHKSPFSSIEITMEYPSKLSSYRYFDSPTFPDSFSFNQKAIDLKQPLAENSHTFAKAQKYPTNNTYEVHENHKDDYFREQDSFQVLAPLLEFTSSQLKSESSILKENVAKKEENKGNKVPNRSRGRRIKTKH